MKKFIFLLTLILGFSCSNTQETVQELNSDELVSDLISISNSYQSAYISQDWEKASEWVSSDLGTTIYNSNGSALVFQDEQQVANTARGWDFDKFEMYPARQAPRGAHSTHWSCISLGMRQTRAHSEAPETHSDRQMSVPQARHVTKACYSRRAM